MLKKDYLYDLEIKVLITFKIYQPKLKP